MRLSRRIDWLLRLVGTTFAVLAPLPAGAVPVTIEITGTILTVEDLAGIFGATPPAGDLVGHYTVDPAAGTVRFGDGVRGQTLPSGTSDVAAGGYRYGGGAAGNTFVDCGAAIQVLPCGSAASAYLITLPETIVGNYVESLTVVLADENASIPLPLPLIPPALDEFETRTFTWRFASGPAHATVRGVVTGLRTLAVPEPAPAALLLGGLMAVALGRRAVKRRSDRPSADCRGHGAGRREA